MITLTSSRIRGLNLTARDESWIAQPLLDAEQIRLDLADLLLDPHFFQGDEFRQAAFGRQLQFAFD